MYIGHFPTSEMGPFKDPRYDTSRPYRGFPSVAGSETSQYSAGKGDDVVRACTHRSKDCANWGPLYLPPVGSPSIPRQKPIPAACQSAAGLGVDSFAACLQSCSPQFQGAQIYVSPSGFPLVSQPPRAKTCLRLRCPFGTWYTISQLTESGKCPKCKSVSDARRALARRVSRIPRQITMDRGGSASHLTSPKKGSGGASHLTSPEKEAASHRNWRRRENAP